MVKKPSGTDEENGGTTLNKSASVFATNPANAICGNTRITVRRVTLSPDLDGAPAHSHPVYLAHNCVMKKPSSLQGGFLPKKIVPIKGLRVNGS